MKKILALSCALVLCCSLFAGCAKDGPSTDTATGTQSSTRTTYIPPSVFPQSSDTSDIAGAVESTDGSGPSGAESVVPQLPTVNLATLSDEAVLETLIASFESSRYNFDINFKMSQKISGQEGVLAEWNGTVWQLGGNKRCEYTFGGREYKACVVNGEYYYTTYDESGNQSLKKNTTADAKRLYLSEQEAYYDTVWNLSLSHFVNAALTRNGGSGYTVTCTDPTVDGVAALVRVAKLLGDPQVSAIANVTVSAVFDSQGGLTGFSYAFDMVLTGAYEGTVHCETSVTGLTHESNQITVSLPDNKDDYKE